LLDEAALIAAMAYVDLTPIRAGMAQTPEQSNYTATQQRIREQDTMIAAQRESCLSDKFYILFGLGAYSSIRRNA